MENKRLYGEIIFDLISELDFVKSGKIIDCISYRLCDCYTYNKKLNYLKPNNFNLINFKSLLEAELLKKDYQPLELEVYRSRNRYGEVYINIEFSIVK